MLSSSLRALPPDCTFTLVAELRDDGGVQPPLGSTTPWIAAEPGLQKTKKKNGNMHDEQETRSSTKVGEYLGGVKTTPVRTLESGAFSLEMWIEEGKGKFEEQLS